MTNKITDDKFSPLTLEDKALFDEIVTNCDLYDELIASEMMFQSLFCWGACENPVKCVLDEGFVVFYEQELRDQNMFFVPFVKKREYFAPVMQMVFDYYKSKNLPVNIKITGEFIPLVKPLLGDEYQILPGFGDTEYIYKASDIVNLPGKKYSTKRNQVEGFEDRYFYTFESYDPSMRQEVLDFAKEWGETHEDETAEKELDTLVRCLDNLDALDMFCDVLKVEGELVGFSAGFVSHTNVGVCMYEKANTEYRGSYQALTNLFAKKRYAKCKYVNRQEDLGIEALKESKMSYHPHMFAKKFIIADKK